MMYNERANIPLIGVMNEARSTQFKKIFNFKKDDEKIKYYVDIGVSVKDFRKRSS